MTDRPQLTMGLAVIIVLSGCTGGVGPNNPDTSTPGTVVTTPTDSTETASTSTETEPPGTATETETSTNAQTATPTETTTPPPTDTVTATSTPTATSIAAATPDVSDEGDAEMDRSDWGDEYVDRLEERGIEVVDLELADDNWMLVYRAESGSWAADADKLQIIAETYCGLFEDGMGVGPDGSDFLGADALDADGDFRYVNRIDPRWCDSTEEGGYQLTEDDFMFTVLNTIDTGEYPESEPLETGDRYLSQETAGEWFVEDVESQGIDVIELEQKSRSDDAEDHVWLLHYWGEADTWGEYAAEIEIITFAYCDLFDEGLAHGEDGSTYLIGEPHDPDGEPFEFRPGWTVRPHLCDDGSDQLMQRAFQSLRL